MTTIHTNSGNIGSVDPIEGEAARVRREREAEKWAALLAGRLGATHTVRPIGGAPEGWRADAKVLTTGSAETTSGPPASADSEGAISGEAGEPDELGAKLSFTVDAGELGELSLVVDRQSDGVRIVIGVSDGAGASTLLPEQAQLERALRNSGVSLSSLSFVRLSGDGPKLAQREVVKRMAPQAGGEGSKRAGDPARRRVNLVG